MYSILKIQKRVKFEEETEEKVESKTIPKKESKVTETNDQQKETDQNRPNLKVV